MSSEPEADPDGLLVFVRALHREAGADFAAALATLSTLLTNVLESPEDPKFRSVRLGNATFHRRLGRFAAALPLLRKFGFEDGQQQDAQAVTHLVLPVADAAHLARCLVLLEAAKQAAEMVAADEAGAPATVSAGAVAAAAAAASGAGSSSGGSAAAAAPSSTALGKRKLSAAAADDAGSSAAAADAGASAPALELDDYSVASIDAFFESVIGDGKYAGQGEATFRRLVETAKDAVDVASATGDSDAVACATKWLAKLSEDGALLGWTADDDDDDDDGGGGCGDCGDVAAMAGGSAAGSSSAAAASTAADDGDGQVCVVCSSSEQEELLLLCDGCDAGYHTYCLKYPLDAVPDDDEWFCGHCGGAG